MVSTAQNTVQGIYLKAEETSPRLITVPLEMNYVEDFFSDEQAGVMMPVLPPLLGPEGQAGYDSLPVQTMGWQGPPLEQPFRLFIRDNFLNDGSPRNMIPSSLTNGRAPYRWAGNLLALKQPELGSETWVDCSMEDVETLTRYFEWYGDRALYQQAKREGLAWFEALFPGANVVSVDLLPEGHQGRYNVDERVID